MSTLKPIIDNTRDHFTGGIMAPIEIVMYGDFQCEYCTAAYPEIKYLQDVMGDDLKFVFRHFPLSNIHPLAFEAAIASEAAALQNKFWYMHDMIFENQKYLTRASLMKFAEDIDLDMVFYESSREHKKLFQKVISDFESGTRSDVNSTPTFFINGLRYNGIDDFGSLYKTCRYLLSRRNLESY